MLSFDYLGFCCNFANVQCIWDHIFTKQFRGKYRDYIEVDHIVMNMNPPKDIKIDEAFKEDNILNAYSSPRHDAQIMPQSTTCNQQPNKKDVENEWERKDDDSKRGNIEQLSVKNADQAHRKHRAEMKQ